MQLLVLLAGCMTIAMAEVARDGQHEYPAPPPGVPSPPPRERPSPPPMEDIEEPAHVRCNREECHERCERYLEGDDGCPTCECDRSDSSEERFSSEEYTEDHPCHNHECGENEVCSIVDCEKYDCGENRYKCLDIPCAMPMCSSYCKHGYATNEHGCMTCECNPDPVREHPAPLTSNKLCNYLKELKETLEAKMEEAHPDLPEDIRHHMGHTTECNDDGTFKPLQCDDSLSKCWCVDDRGLEIPDTRGKIEDDLEEMPECEHYKTTQLMFSMLLTHTYENVHEHLDSIKDAVSDHMSKWTNMDEKYIEVIEIIPPKHTETVIEIQVILHHDDKSDLAYIAQKFMIDAGQKEHVIKCPKGGELKVDGKSIRVGHHTQPAHPKHHGSSEEDDHDEEIEDWIKEHKVETGVISFAAVVMIVLSIILCAVGCRVCRKRRSASMQFKHTKMDKYRENLAFQNDMLGKPDKVQILSVIRTDETEPTKY